MKVKKYAAALLAVIILFHTFSMTAFAHDVPDLTREGTVSVVMEYHGKAVSGGTLILYRVGDIQEDNGDIAFTLNTAFAASNVSLSDLSSAELPIELAKYASTQKLPGTTQTIDGNGKAFYQNILPGLYLVVQENAADGYEKAEPFLISLPYMEDGSYVYDVGASPKIELQKPSKPDEPDQTTDSTLPQTGQLNWPISLLAVAGLLLFTGGWILRFTRKESDHEG